MWTSATRTTLLITATILLPCTAGAAEDNAPFIPAIEGEWWSIASTPRLPDAYHSDDQEPVDFAIWQATDGTWQVWSCIRHTTAGGHSRLFHGWEGASLFDTEWKPLGIVMESDARYGEPKAGLQAPHVVRLPERYLMAYGNWDEICFAESRDGKTFTRIVQPDGRTGVFGEGPKGNARDPMLVRIGGEWFCYYTAILNEKGYGLCRTSRSLQTWSDAFVVSYGGRVGPGPWFNECPHVIEAAPGEYLYFRNQYYGTGQTNWVYYSRNPRYFGVDDDSGLVAQLSVAAPELIQHEGAWYIASLKPSLDGIQIAKLRLYRADEPGAPARPTDSAQGADN